MSAPIQRLYATLVRRWLSKPPPLPQVRAMSAKSGGGMKEIKFVRWARRRKPETQIAKPSQAQAKTSIKQQSSIKEVYPHGQQPQISFSDQDLQGVHLPHDDALVINMRIANFEVRRVLIDNGAGGNILNSSTLDNMKIDKSKLTPSNNPIIGFGGGRCGSIGVVELPVTIGTGPKLLTKFFVVEVTMPYDAIVGRPWLHDQGVIPSSLHQCLKFALGDEVITIRGDQSISRECNAADMFSQVPANPSQAPAKPSIEQQPSPEAEMVGLGDYLLFSAYFAVLVGGPLLFVVTCKL